MEALMVKIVAKFLWEANGWVLIALAFAALSGFLLSYLASAAGNGPMANMIGAVTTFTGISMVLIVVGSVFKKILQFILGWG